jgi:outer membrane protein assembly factor BamD
MSRFKLTFAVILVLAAVAGCRSQYDTLLYSNDVDAKYDAAMSYYNKHKYQKAAALFESMSVQVGGTPKEDTVLYYWGLSNYYYKDYFTAEANFSKFVQTFPRSPFTEEARFLRIDCLYRQTLRWELDQKATITCLTAINEFNKDYPNNSFQDQCQPMVKNLNDRLDRKSYEAAKLYYNMEEYRAARVAFKNILKDDAENIYREDILYYIAMSSYKYAQNSVPEKQKERYMTFEDDYMNFISEAPDSPYRNQLDNNYARAQKALGKFGAVPGSSSEYGVVTKHKLSKEEKQDLKAEKKEERAAAKAAKKAGRKDKTGNY